MRLIWTVSQLAGIVYDWPTILPRLHGHAREKRKAADYRSMLRLLRRRGVSFMKDGRAIKVTSKALRELYPEVWDGLSSASVAHGCPECGADVACTECKWSSDEEEAA